MNWQEKKNDEAKLSLCSQILSSIALITLMRSPILVLLDDQTRSDLSCLSASEESISVNAHFRLFPWKIHKLIWVEMIERVLNFSRQDQDILQMLRVFTLTFMKELENSTEW